MTFSDDMIEKASWFIAYAGEGRTHWTTREMLAQRFKLTPDEALTLFKIVKGGISNADAS
ncbi:hypothetical protein FJW04_21880 [Mesorhizobium sp. B2-7-3]|uniref:hypothetical protein n=1 Tax=unclassified Mesorhizobium TaxID=325217 RepID=UPI00112AFAD3|nr:MULTISPECIES: hypothetical protein [unclassified Mesorhizobium]MBZ9927750.1 hypothetical protein [Mesorhizobium sp. BR1-1-4]TPJ12909.1 hypothetical protein FJW04_21880 [Mesorhizobium sp. B2-7-3]